MRSRSNIQDVGGKACIPQRPRKLMATKVLASKARHSVVKLAILCGPIAHSGS